VLVLIVERPCEHEFAVIAVAMHDRRSAGLTDNPRVMIPAVGTNVGRLRHGC